MPINKEDPRPCVRTDEAVDLPRSFTDTFPCGRSYVNLIYVLLSLSKFKPKESNVKSIIFADFFQLQCLRQCRRTTVFSSDNTKKYDSQFGFLATEEKFHFYLVTNRFSLPLTRNLVSWAGSLFIH